VELSWGEIDEGASVRFVSTHFDHLGQASREAAAREINRLFGTANADPVVLAGDLNAIPDSETLDILRQEWVDTSRETQVVGRPERQIDYVLCRPASQWKVVEVRVLNERVASDHRPVLAVLEWTGG
jgi:endonuclease/exonuclease/phosphatase family metal-dependent hydrolase